MIDETTKNMHKSALKLIREQIKKHSLGELVFLAFVGTRPWGIGRENVDYDYRGIYASKQENTYQAFISQIYINNYAKDITLISLERFIDDILHSNIHSLLYINSPIIYATKEFFKFKKWVNSHFSKQVFQTAQTKKVHMDRKDYLYDFFFIGNGISILEKKKVIANLPELNRKFLKITALNKVIEEEKKEMPFKFKDEKICKKILLKLKKRLEIAYKKSSLPEEINTEKLLKLKIIKKINYKFWGEEKDIRYQKEREKYAKTKKTKKR